jgi:hypothetical protein
MARLLCVVVCRCEHRGAFVAKEAMRNQSELNEFASETHGLEREASFTQKQLALHEQLDRVEEKHDYNLGLAEGAAGMAEMGDDAAHSDAFASLAASASSAQQLWAAGAAALLEVARHLPAK